MSEYADHPRSITEIKADKAARNGGTVWTPRDALIAVLRQIDAGEIKPDALVVCYSELRDEEHKVVAVQSTPTWLHSVGLLEAAKANILE